MNQDCSSTSYVTYSFPKWTSRAIRDLRDFYLSMHAKHAMQTAYIAVLDSCESNLSATSMVKDLDLDNFDRRQTVGSRRIEHSIYKTATKFAFSLSLV